MMMKKKPGMALLAVATLFSGVVMAQDLTIKVSNLTTGMYFTPLLVSAHDSGQRLFMTGMAASANLQAMAEGGDIAGLVSDLQGVGADIRENPAAGLLAPGASTTMTMTTQAANTRLSLVAMLLPTNDGFVGLDSLVLPTAPGTYRYALNAYDAGTEANDEIVNGGGAPGVAGIPADPGGKAGTGATGVAASEANTTVHIHPGNIGDSNATGGSSDVDNRVHRWLNPVAELVITVN